MNKVCGKCKIKERLPYHNYFCRDCKNEYNRLWYKKNPEYNKKYKKNPEYRKKISQRWKETGGYEKFEKYKNTKDDGLFKVWLSLRGRCKYPSHNRYEYYGGRGIKCLWDGYQDFKEDMCKSFLKHLKKFGWKNTTIDRVDVNGHYCKENCRWATWSQQMKNRRKFRRKPNKVV